MADVDDMVEKDVGTAVSELLLFGTTESHLIHFIFLRQDISQK